MPDTALTETKLQDTAIEEETTVHTEVDANRVDSEVTASGPYEYYETPTDDDSQRLVRVALELLETKSATR